MDVVASIVAVQAKKCNSCEGCMFNIEDAWLFKDCYRPKSIKTCASDIIYVIKES